MKGNFRLFRARTLLRGVMVVLTLSTFGCASVAPSKPMTLQQRQALNERLGTVAVVHATYNPTTEIQLPAKGSLEGAGGGFVSGVAAPFQMLEGCHGDGCGFIALLAIVAAPVTAVIGGVGGAAIAESSESVEQNEAQLNTALAALKMQEALAGEVIDKLQALDGMTGRLHADAGPTIEGEARDYTGLAGAGSVLEVALTRYQLEGDGHVNPEMTLTMEATSRMVGLPSGETLHTEFLLQ